MTRFPLTAREGEIRRRCRCFFVSRFFAGRAGRGSRFGLRAARVQDEADLLGIARSLLEICLIAWRGAGLWPL